MYYAGAIVARPSRSETDSPRQRDSAANILIQNKDSLINRPPFLVPRRQPGMPLASGIAS